MPLYGKHRAHVVDNKDPEMRGRLMVFCPSLYPKSPTTVTQSGDWSDTNNEYPVIGWCEAALPYADFMIPPIGKVGGETGVWLEFEGGNPAYPIWTGVWYSRNSGVRPALNGEGGSAAYTTASTPYARIIYTENCRLTLDDTPNATNVLLETPLGSLSLDDTGGVSVATLNANGLTIVADATPGASKIVLTSAINTVTLDDAGGITLENAVGSIFMNAAGQFALTGAGGNELLAVLGALMIDIQTGACAAPGSPLVMPTFTVDLAKLTAITA